MTAPPEQLTYGKILWSVIGLTTDEVDADTLPDIIPINGSATIKADVVGAALHATNLPTPLTILLRGMPLNIVNGKLVDRGGNTQINLLACDCPALAEIDWSYTITWELNDGFSFGSFSFKVLTGEVKDLTLASPLAVADDGTVIIQGPPGPSVDEATLGTYEPVPDTLVRRAPNGWIGVDGIYGIGDPNNPDDVANKGYTDTKVAGNNGINAIVKLTQSAYDALVTKVATTLYVIQG